MMQIPKTNWGENILKGQFSPFIPIKETSGVSCGKLRGILWQAWTRKSPRLYHRFGYWMTKAQTLFLPGFIGVCITATILILLGRNDKAACLELANKLFSRNLWNDKGRKSGDVVRPINWSFCFFFPTRSGPHFVAFFFGLAVWHSWGLWYRRPSELLECLGPNLLSMQPARFNFSGLFHRGQLHV